MKTSFTTYILTLLALLSQWAINASEINLKNLFDIPLPSQTYAPCYIAQLNATVQEAVAHGKKVAIVGAGKSQGGQTMSAHQGAYRISLHNLNKLIELNTQEKTATVEAGMTWKQLQEYIAPHGLAVKAMQSYNDFSIGGSVSVNVHGQDLATGQIISTIISLQVLTPDGKTITVNQQENGPLFSAIVGGYGLVGIIVWVKLQLTDDIVLERNTKVINTSALADHLKSEVLRNNSEFYSARFTVGTSNFMDKALVITYKKAADQHQGTLQLLPTQKSSFIRWFIQATASFSRLKQLRFYVEKWLLSKPEIISRNNILNYSIAGLPDNNKSSEYILQEYFLPYDHVTAFIQDFRDVTTKYAINVLNVTARHVLQDKLSLLSFAPHSNMCALVIYIALPKTEQARADAILWTQTLIERALAHNGTYYLPYHVLGTHQQFTAAYPQWNRLMAIKKQYDSHNVLSNKLYEAYA